MVKKQIAKVSILEDMSWCKDKGEEDGMQEVLGGREASESSKGTRRGGLEVCRLLLYFSRKGVEHLPPSMRRIWTDFDDAGSSDRVMCWVACEKMLE